ncbi:MAG: ribonuclease HIII [Verrucomicrobia bacterium]|jgi:ribonuclease HIII|nr:MAG: ribonuclease HIII [Verrucomicrobiota bacterium]MDH4469779.1 ribonuclease HIII [Verrucomicrobiae bacterium]
MPSPLHSHTISLTTAQAEKLRGLLKNRNFVFESKPYTLFAGHLDRLSIAVYEKGPKLLLQGRGIEDFITFTLEPEITGIALLGYDDVHSPEQFSPHFGIDESGKGDFLGPLVIAGVYVNEELAKHFRDSGIRDSKGIGSDKKIRELATLIRSSQAPIERIVISPLKYNELYKNFKNLNSLLAWGHARVLENLCERVPNCPRALSDKFANERVLQNALQEKGKKLQLDQRTKAESDYAVAAASIIAREGFIDWLEKEGNRLQILLPKGVSAKVKQTASTLLKQHGPLILPQIAKMHFKTTSEITS